MDSPVPPPVPATQAAVLPQASKVSNLNGILLVVASCILLVAAVIFMVTRLNGGGITGTWVISEVEMNGVLLSVEDAEAMSGQTFDVSFEFMRDGQVNAIVNMGGSEDGATGDYDVNGNEVAVTFDGDTQIMTLEDGKLSVEQGGAMMILEKK
jgi:hypothetical protein